MGGNYIGDAGLFLIQTLFGIYLLAVLLRFLLQVARADFYNPVSQLLYRVTQPLVRPLQYVFPTVGSVNLAVLVLLILLKFVEMSLVSALAGQPWHPPRLLVLGLSELVALATTLYFFTILIQVILSWVNPGAHHPALVLLWQLNEPLLGPARRLLPALGGLDLSPIVVLIALQLVNILVAAPLQDLAFRL